ncbi:MAG: hypothetical protein Q7S34_03250 [bacterium]|nr:hypothetical protein [bacterium]
MEVSTVLIEWDEDPSVFDREKFIDVFRNHARPLIGREPNLEFALREIVKNIYDHARGRGAMKIVVSGAAVYFLAYDFGPGYQGASPDRSPNGLYEFHSQNKSSKRDSVVNRGIGLRFIVNGLNDMRAFNEEVVWRMETQGRFLFEGSYISSNKKGA